MDDVDFSRALNSDHLLCSQISLFSSFADTTFTKKLEQSVSPAPGWVYITPPILQLVELKWDILKVTWSMQLLRFLLLERIKVLSLGRTSNQMFSPLCVQWRVSIPVQYLFDSGIVWSELKFGLSFHVSKISRQVGGSLLRHVGVPSSRPVSYFNFRLACSSSLRQIDSSSLRRQVGRSSLRI
jgi:hypothetical protein